MINHLDGTIEDFDDEVVVLNVNGIGFEILVGRVSGVEIGKSLRLYTVWRFNSEDGYTIFGFETPQESKLLKTITSKVSGVGGKTALSLLKTLTPGQIADAVIHEKAHVFRAVSGIGPKMSERIVLELRDVMAGMPVQPGSIGKSDEIDEAREALRALGFSIGEIEKAFDGIKGKGASSEEIIKHALSRLSK